MTTTARTAVAAFAALTIVGCDAPLSPHTQENIIVGPALRTTAGSGHTASDVVDGNWTVTLPFVEAGGTNNIRGSEELTFQGDHIPYGLTQLTLSLHGSTGSSLGTVPATSDAWTNLNPPSGYRLKQTTVTAYVDVNGVTFCNATAVAFATFSVGEIVQNTIVPKPLAPSAGQTYSAQSTPNCQPPPPPLPPPPPEYSCSLDTQLIYWRTETNIGTTTGSPTGCVNSGGPPGDPWGDPGGTCETDWIIIQVNYGDGWITIWSGEVTVCG